SMVASCWVSLSKLYGSFRRGGYGELFRKFDYCYSCCAGCFADCCFACGLCIVVVYIFGELSSKKFCISRVIRKCELCCCVDFLNVAWLGCKHARNHRRRYLFK